MYDRPFPSGDSFTSWEHPRYSSTGPSQYNTPQKKNRGRAPLPKPNNEVVRLLWAALPDEITAFLNVCLELGSFPVAWKNSNLKLLYKGRGAVSDVNSYRGISLCCSLYNLLDRVMNNRLYSRLIDLIPSNLFGFVKGRSTIQAVQLLVDEINFVVYEKKTPLYSLFLDVKKAFDSIRLVEEVEVEAADEE
ncbi:Hypothetical predicted protein [Cloeon dipterum]|uniref:Reverse transcriptase domain-containing protein n=1 Tax=Cloeon dipterum TaxID=197152 RepID=A0A8S1E2Q5_9INSE|nr:Hypothetical predicted protein [Cloeon dipterum]